jgi:hypothetical protein
MKILLIASNPDVKIPEESFDCYVHFNKGINFNKTPSEKSVMFVRTSPRVDEAKSFYYSAGSKKASSVFAMGYFEDIKKIDKNISYIPIDEIPYPDGYNPTSGWAAIQYLIKLNYEIYVCGFDLKSAWYYGRRSGHFFDYEIEQLDILIQSGAVKVI